MKHDGLNVRVRLTFREWIGFYRIRDKRCDCPGCG